ncbi:MAG: hypothetical protein M3P93_17265 [Actinomycetota bacterium]|nr:hypothetical protein [Actinomycetota bacterium]
MSLFALPRLQVAGHRPIALAGGATGQGDPRARDSERVFSRLRRRRRRRAAEDAGGAGRQAGRRPRAAGRQPHLDGTCRRPRLPARRRTALRVKEQLRVRKRSSRFVCPGQRRCPVRRRPPLSVGIRVLWLLVWLPVETVAVNRPDQTEPAPRRCRRRRAATVGAGRAW